MAESEDLVSYPPTYRAKEMQSLAQWIATGASGSVVGLVGCGRSSFLRFFCDHPEIVQRYLPSHVPQIVLISIDLYDLPSEHLEDLYRTILHAFYWVRERLPTEFASVVASQYLEHRTIRDPFVVQKALYEVLRASQTAGLRVVMIMNRFDTFCEKSTSQQVNTLRSLRDRFKETLSYIVGMRQEVVYMSDPTKLGDMYELFDSHVCYIGALAPEDSHNMLWHLLRATPVQPDLAEIEMMLELSGGFPSILKAIGQWWQMAADRPQTLADWGAHLLYDPTMRHRLERLWQGLTQEEQQILSELQRRDTARRAPGTATLRAQQRKMALARLIAKGGCLEAGVGYQINGTLLSEYTARQAGRIRGRIWHNEAEHMIYQGKAAITDLTQLEYGILSFLLEHPGARLLSDTIIDHVWPQGDNREVVIANNLQVHIVSIRRKIEVIPAEPRYLITWYGKPGGYQFFPEGRPD